MNWKRTVLEDGTRKHRADTGARILCVYDGRFKRGIRAKSVYWYIYDHDEKVTSLKGDSLTVKMAKKRAERLSRA